MPGLYRTKLSLSKLIYMRTTKNIAISSRRGECDINFNKSSSLYLSRVHSGS